MSYFLFKSEPGVYSFDDLLRDGETVWDGVTAPTAVKNLREMKPGTKWIFYHTGDERTAVGTGTVLSVDATDPKSPDCPRQGRQTPQESEDPRTNQGRKALRPLAAGAYRPALGGSAHQRAVGLVCKVRKQCSKISLFPYGGEMLAKLTVKNQLTLPKAVAKNFAGVEYFDVSTDGNSITLRPLQRSRADEVREYLANLGITEQDVKDAIAWARSTE